MTNKYETLKTTDIGAPWNGEVEVDNVRTYPDEDE